MTAPRPTLAAPFRRCLFCALLGFLASCTTAPTTPRESTAESTTPTWQPSPNRLVGRIHTVDMLARFVVIEASPYAGPPPPAGTELLVRTEDLTATARLRLSHFTQGRTLGAEILAGFPSPDEEVVWPRPTR